MEAFRDVLDECEFKDLVLWEGSTHGIGGQEGVPLFGNDLIVQLLQQTG